MESILLPLLQDEERLKKAVNQVPSHEELNAMVARSESELQLFNQMDAELDWPDEQGTASYSCKTRPTLRAGMLWLTDQRRPLLWHVMFLTVSVREDGRLLSLGYLAAAG